MSQSYQERNPARRTFAWEFKDATHQEQGGEDEGGAHYQILPTGERANRVFIVGTLAEVIDNDDNEDYIQGELRDPTGRFYIDAGQYHPKAVANMRRLEPPEYVAVTGKATQYSGNNGPVTKVRVENITDVPDAIYDHWVAETAIRTIERLQNFGDEGNKAAETAAEEYGVNLEEYRDAAIEALDTVQELIENDVGADTSSTTQSTEPSDDNTEVDSDLPQASDEEVEAQLN